MKSARDGGGGARGAILAGVRRSLGVNGAEAPRLFDVERRLAEAPRGVQIQRGRGDRADRLATFRAEAERAQATVVEVASLDDVPAEVARFLRDANCPATLRMGADPRLAAMPWSATTLEVTTGPSDGGDLNAVTMALAGIAETGTVALVSGPDNPTTLNFLPDNAIVVVRGEDVVTGTEEAFDRLRERFGKGCSPRTLNFVTGPSRSGDIELVLLLGAHGPRRLHIVIAG